ADPRGAGRPSTDRPGAAPRRRFRPLHAVARAPRAGARQAREPEAQTMTRTTFILAVMGVSLGGCDAAPPSDRIRVSGQVEATDVRVAALVGGRLLELRVTEGDRVNAGDVVARLDTADTELLLTR